MIRRMCSFYLILELRELGDVAIAANSSMVGLCVCLLVMFVSCANMAEPTEMLFGGDSGGHKELPSNTWFLVPT